MAPGSVPGGRASSERSDWVIDQGWERYAPAAHNVCRTLFERQTRLLPGRACDEFVWGMNNLPIGADEIPDFRRVNEILVKRTGWQIVAVPGLVPDAVFFEHLANRRFPAGNFIRRAFPVIPAKERLKKLSAMRIREAATRSSVLRRRAAALAQDEA